MNIENQYNVKFLIEKNISAEIWNPEIEVFKNKLNDNPTFSHINTYTFGENNHLLITDENNKPVNLLDNKSSENNLIFIISDARSILWRNSENRKSIFRYWI